MICTEIRPASPLQSLLHRRSRQSSRGQSVDQSHWEYILYVFVGIEAGIDEQPPVFSSCVAILRVWYFWSLRWRHVRNRCPLRVKPLSTLQDQIFEPFHNTLTQHFREDHSITEICQRFGLCFQRKCIHLHLTLVRNSADMSLLIYPFQESLLGRFWGAHHAGCRLGCPNRRTSLMARDPVVVVKGAFVEYAMMSAPHLKWCLHKRWKS